MNHITTLPQTETKDRYAVPLLLLVLSDFLIFSSSLLAAYSIRFFSIVFEWFPPPSPPYIPNFTSYIRLSLFIGVVGVLVFERLGLYERRVGFDRQAHSSSRILGILVSYIFLMALLFNYRGFSFSRLTVGLAIPIACVGMTVQQHALRWLQMYLIRNGILFFKTILVGPLERCAQVNEKLQKHYGSKFQLIGRITTEPSTGSDPHWIPCLGSVKDLPQVLQSSPIDNVIIAMPPDDQQSILKVMETCTAKGVSYRVIPELFDLLSQRISLQEVPALPTILFDETPLSGFGQIAKRSMDILISSIMLIVASPIMLLIALLIRLDSKGPVFYVQQRVGNDGNKFEIFKFRSMIDNAELNTGPKWATTNDPRTTRIGRFLRRYNLDELPQFLNVLRGDMSLVGPRPERPYFVDKFKEEIPYYMRRHMVKSGITGWAQVNGWRGDTSVMERTQHDLYYVENWSILLDLKILWKTLTSFKNAY